MSNLTNILIVGLGGALGSMLRYGVTLLYSALNWSGNLSTMTVNVLGSFAIAYLSGVVKDAPMLLLLTVGLCGGFTTFSTFSLQSVRLIQDGRFLVAGLYAVATFVLCLVFAGLGWWLGHK